ncbi:hypothetical protein [Rhodococcus qingshengii]|uniref:hypothetical protein n=1 Tax=Rhodococcus qingshengii TaxID=334542 RepID=UPI001BE86641|nr:hypothetical protein [Rhodococcus qingshengii]MBT2275370.1 hypothetical protein [Rhodococcus qingshengii]
MMHRTVDDGPGAEDSGSEVAVFQYGSDRYEIPLDEAKRLMIDVQDVLNDQGAGLVRVRVDGGEAVFLISGGAVVTFHVPDGTTYYDGEDPAADSSSSKS